MRKLFRSSGRRRCTYSGQLRATRLTREVLDLFIDYDRDSRFNAFDLVGIKQYLENELGTGVDVTTRDGLHPMLRADIEKSAIRVF